MLASYVQVKLEFVAMNKKNVMHTLVDNHETIICVVLIGILTKLVRKATTILTMGLKRILDNNKQEHFLKVSATKAQS